MLLTGQRSHFKVIQMQITATVYNPKARTYHHFFPGVHNWRRSDERDGESKCIIEGWVALSRNKMKDIFARWGVPEEIVSDNGPQFSSEQFRKFSQEYDFKHFTTSPYYPQANGEAESGVRIAKKILKQRDPFLALMSYRATPHTATGVSPCQLMMGREIRTLLPTLESNLKQVLPSQEALARKDEETKTAYRRHFDKRHGVRPLSDLQPGPSVRVKLDQQKSMEDTWERHRKTSGS